MSLFSRPGDRDTGLTPERIREVCDAIPTPTVPEPLHPERTPFTADELDRLWCAMYPTDLPCEARWSPAKRARLDQLRAALRDGAL